MLTSNRRLVTHRALISGKDGLVDEEQIVVQPRNVASRLAGIYTMWPPGFGANRGDGEEGETWEEGAWVGEAKDGGRTRQSLAQEQIDRTGQNFAEPSTGCSYLSHSVLELRHSGIRVRPESKKEYQVDL